MIDLLEPVKELIDKCLLLTFALIALLILIYAIEVWLSMREIK